jgi:hypothetical protein
VGSWDSLPRPLLRGLEQAVAVQRAPVASYVARLRRTRSGATPSEIITVLEKQYLRTVTGTGAAVGGVAAAPGVGTLAALALGGGESAAFLEATALFALAVAEVHGIRIEDRERRRTLLLAVVLGDHASKLVQRTIRRESRHWGYLLPAGIPLTSISALNRTLIMWFLRKYARKQGLLMVGKIAPFGIGAAVGAKGNRVLGRQVVHNCREVFGPAPVSFANSAVS